MPEELRVQIPVIRELAAAFGWPLLQEPEYEADDLIAAFAAAPPGRYSSSAPTRIFRSSSTPK